MDLPPAWCQACICGRTFSLPQAYTYHKRTCEKTKKRLSGAWDKAKEVWKAKKRQKIEAKATEKASQSNFAVSGQPLAMPKEQVPLPEVRIVHATHCSPELTNTCRTRLLRHLWSLTIWINPSQSAEIAVITASYPNVFGTCYLSHRQHSLYLLHT
jgi:hypothetical protein